jgi:hypothetical protein
MTEYLAVFEAFDPELLVEPLRDFTRIDARTFERALVEAEAERASLYRSGFASNGALVHVSADLAWRIVAITEVTPAVVRATVEAIVEGRGCSKARVNATDEKKGK